MTSKNYLFSRSVHQTFAGSNALIRNQSPLIGSKSTVTPSAGLKFSALKEELRDVPPQSSSIYKAIDGEVKQHHSKDHFRESGNAEEVEHSTNDKQGAETCCQDSYEVDGQDLEDNKKKKD